METKFTDTEKLIEYGFSALAKTDVSINALANIDKCVQAIYRTYGNGGKVILSGVGKNVPVCEKLAGTFNSLGIPAQYLDVTHAMHGDLGMLRYSDTLITFSKSGTTSELLHMLKYIHDNRAEFPQELTIASIDCSENYINPYADIQIRLKQRAELDTDNLVPTISLLAMQMIGDVIAIQTSHEITKHDDTQGKAKFVLTHPGGSIGKTEVKNILQ